MTSIFVFVINSPSESTRNSSGTSLNTREKTVQDPLTGKERLVGSKLVGDGSGRSDRPILHHRMLGLDSLELGLEDDVLDEHSNKIAGLA
jgi:hypothetical protein